MQIVRENENVKKLMEEQELKREEFAEDFHMYGDSNEIKVEEPANSIIPEEEFSSHVKRPKETCNFFINLTEAERVLIQASSFLELNANLDEM
jgi:hypothetical protein